MCFPQLWRSFDCSDPSSDLPARPGTRRHRAMIRKNPLLVKRGREELWGRIRNFVSHKKLRGEGFDEGMITDLGENGGSFITRGK